MRNLCVSLFVGVLCAQCSSSFGMETLSSKERGDFAFNRSTLAPDGLRWSWTNDSGCILRKVELKIKPKKGSLMSLSQSEGSELAMHCDSGGGKSILSDALLGVIVCDIDAATIISPDILLKSPIDDCRESLLFRATSPAHSSMQVNQQS